MQEERTESAEDGAALNPAARDFVERLGMQVEREGLSRSAGRIAAYLMLQEEPRSLEEIADALHLSRGSVSTNARFLERVGVAERVGIPGDRRDYYRTVPDFPEAMMGVWRQRFAEMMDLLDRTLEDLPSDEDPGRERVTRLLDFYRELDRQMEALRQRWTGASEERGNASP